MLEQTDISQFDNENLSKLKPMGVADILDGTFSFYSIHLALFLGIASIYFIANLIEYSLKGLSIFGVKPRCFNSGDKSKCLILRQRTSIINKPTQLIKKHLYKRT